jgi:hypothetical protein
MTKFTLLLVLPLISLSCKTMNKNSSEAQSVAGQDSRGNFVVFQGAGEGGARQVTLYRCGKTLITGVDDPSCSKADSKNWTRDILEPLKRTSHVSGDRVISAALNSNPDAIFGVLKRPDIFQSPDLQASWDALTRGLMEIFVNDPLAHFAHIATANPTPTSTGIFPGSGIYASEKQSCVKLITDFEMYLSYELDSRVTCWFVITIDSLRLLTITVTDEYGINHALDMLPKEDDGSFEMDDERLTFEIREEKAVFSRAGKSLDLARIANHSNGRHSERLGRALGGFTPLPGKRDDVIDNNHYFSEDNSGFYGYIKLGEDGHAVFRPNGQSKTFDGHYTLEWDRGQYYLVVYYRGGEAYRAFRLDSKKCWLHRSEKHNGTFKSWYLHARHDSGCSVVPRPNR